MCPAQQARYPLMREIAAAMYAQATREQPDPEGRRKLLAHQGGLPASHPEYPALVARAEALRVIDSAADHTKWWGSLLSWFIPEAMDTACMSEDSVKWLLAQPWERFPDWRSERLAAPGFPPELLPQAQAWLHALHPGLTDEYGVTTLPQMQGEEAVAVGRNVSRIGRWRAVTDHLKALGVWERLGVTDLRPLQVIGTDPVSGIWVSVLSGPLTTLEEAHRVYTDTARRGTLRWESVRLPQEEDAPGERARTPPEEKP